MVSTMLAVCTVCLAAPLERDVPARVVQGEYRCRVLLIDFEGRERVHPPESFQTIFFGSNVLATPDRFKEPMCGSAREYFATLSKGRVRLVGEVMPWVRSRHKVEDLPHWSKRRDGGHDWWQPVVVDAMSLNNIPADDRIDGKPVSFYAVIYAGPPYGYFKCIKKSTFMGAGRRGLSSRECRRTKVPFWEDRWNGKQIIFCPERWRQEESGLFGVGFICHELGHMLGNFHDLYGAENGDFGRWSIMGLGDKTHFPSSPTAFNLYRAGWASYDVPAQSGRRRMRLPPIEAGRAVKLVNGPMPWADALVVEYRVRSCPNDRTLPAEGLLVYQIPGRRRVRVVSWDDKAKRASMREQRFRVVRADDSPQNQAGDAFREGGLALFGKPASASSATGCGYWELENVTLPKTPTRPSSRTSGLATFDVVYRPEQIPARRGGGLIDVGGKLSPGNWRVHVQAVGGASVIHGDQTILVVPPAANGQVVWGLVDVRTAADGRQLAVVPAAGGRIEEIQAVPRAPVIFSLLSQPVAGQIAAGLSGRISPSAELAGNVYAGGAIEIPLAASRVAKATVPGTCPGGFLRLALRSVVPTGGSSPTITLVLRGESGEQKYLNKVALDARQPEFFLIDLWPLKGKPIQLDLSFQGPEGSRVVLWDAAFMSN